MNNDTTSIRWRLFIVGPGLGLALVVLLALNWGLSKSAEAPPLPTATPTLAASETPQPSATLKAAMTPTPGVTPAPTLIFEAPTPLPAHYYLPDWLKHPSPDTLLAITRNDRATEFYFTFIDVAHERQFKILMPQYTDSVKWRYTETGWAIEYIRSELHSDINTIIATYYEQLDLATGNVRRTQLGEGDGQTLTPRLWFHGTYVAEVHNEYKPSVVTISNWNTHQDFPLTDPFVDDYPDYASVSWAPQQNLLAVTRYKWPGEMFGPSRNELLVYTAEGDLYRLYSNIYGASWTPDGSQRILYGGRSDEGISEPCILDLTQNTKNCLANVLAWTKRHSVNTGSYQWLPSGKEISFLYWNNRTGGICITQVGAPGLICPIDDSWLDNNHYVIDYGWTGDEQYLWFTDDASPPGSDDHSFAQIATAEKDGYAFFTNWGYGYQPQWRPPDPP